jgi:hypothetical protein
MLSTFFEMMLSTMAPLTLSETETEDVSATAIQLEGETHRRSNFEGNQRCQRPRHNCSKQAWLLKNSFQRFQLRKFVRKLLIVRLLRALKFAEITALVPFSTATGDFTNDAFRTNIGPFIR